jgi:ribosomal protein S12
MADCDAVGHATSNPAFDSATVRTIMGGNTKRTPGFRFAVVQGMRRRRGAGTRTRNPAKCAIELDTGSASFACIPE